MQYILMLYVNEAGWPKLTKAEQEQGMAAYTAFTEALKNAGVLASANRLQPSSNATTVRVANGKSQVLDGPMRTPKSNWAATTSSTCPISMPRSRGRPVVRPQVTVSSRCVHCGECRRDLFTRVKEKKHAEISRFQ